MKTYQGDPYWLTAKFNSKCQCGTDVRKGERVFYYPNGKRVLCVKCSDKASADFAACAMDEAFACGETY